MYPSDILASDRQFLVKSMDSGREFCGTFTYIEKDPARKEGFYVVVDEGPPLRKLFGPLHSHDWIMEPKTRKTVVILPF